MNTTTDNAGLSKGYPKRQPRKRCAICQRSEGNGVHLVKMLGAKINAPLLQYICDDCKRKH